jgi:hypothetical protein
MGGGRQECGEGRAKEVTRAGAIISGKPDFKKFERAREKR